MPGGQGLASQAGGAGQAGGQGTERYLWGDLSKWLQGRRRHLERLQLSRGHHLGGWSQVRRQVGGRWLQRAHRLWGQDLRQGYRLGQERRLERERGASLRPVSSWNIYLDTTHIHTYPQ